MVAIIIHMDFSITYKYECSKTKSLNALQIGGATNRTDSLEKTTIKMKQHTQQLD